MKLYVYEHCPFCCKARMIFGLKQLPVELKILLEDDVDTPTKLVGKKIAPILEKEDGSHMAESMDIVHYVDERYGEPEVAPVADSAIQTWHDTAWRPIHELAIPRLAEADFAEFATPEAREAFRVRQTKNVGDFGQLLASSPLRIVDMEKQLKELDRILAGRKQLDADDFLLYPSLRMLSIVKGINYPDNVKAYMQRMAQSSGVALHLDQAA